MPTPADTAKPSAADFRRAAVSLRVDADLCANDHGDVALAAGFARVATWCEHQSIAATQAEGRADGR